ncbi:hypothetical protein, partial [Aeromonas bestiarum]|uniref:hypothetical protein n=1 Tax=Aeromonas bestiarum TaxID=105751 RepID=UPI0032B2B5FD
PDIENQQNCLMFDAVSAHTDCLIQIVKERRNSVAAGVEFYSTAFSSQALFSKAFRGTDRLYCVAACPVDVAHYRDLDHAGKRCFELNSNY